MTEERSRSRAISRNYTSTSSKMIEFVPVSDYDEVWNDRVPAETRTSLSGAQSAGCHLIGMTAKNVTRVQYSRHWSFVLAVESSHRPKGSIWNGGRSSTSVASGAGDLSANLHHHWRRRNTVEDRGNDVACVALACLSPNRQP